VRTEHRARMLTLGSCVGALVTCCLILLVVEVFSPCSAHPRHSVAHPHQNGHPHRRPHTKSRRFGPEVVRTRWRRGHARRNHRSRHRMHHRRRYDDEDVIVARETDKMADEAINRLFGARQFAPMALLHRRPAAAKDSAPGPHKPTAGVLL